MQYRHGMLKLQTFRDRKEESGRKRAIMCFRNGGKMIRILAIGNSFSEDATYYLHQILEAAGVENLDARWKSIGLILKMRPGNISFR